MAVRTTFLVILFLSLSLALSACPKREQPPKNAYDPELMATAAELAKDKDKGPSDTSQGETAEEEGECNRTTGGCEKGYLCWDSWYCKHGQDTCSAMGDKRCHKICIDDKDCPKDMPRCAEKPIFRGSDRGQLEKFCVAPE